MPKRSVLFVCTANSARSQMAEGFARYYAGALLEVESAGTHPGQMNPFAVQVMNEAGVDIAHQTPKSLGSKKLEEYDYVVTVCGDARDSCPVLPPHVNTEHWPIPDPARVRGTPQQISQAFRVIRNQIEERVQNFLARIL